MTLPKILVVEDDHFYQGQWLRELAGRAAILPALDQTAAQNLFQAHSDLALIVMDGYVPGPKESTTLELVRQFRQTFQGPIIAVSTSINRALMEAGCDYTAEKEKLAALVNDLLAHKS